MSYKGTAWGTSMQEIQDQKTSFLSEFSYLLSWQTGILLIEVFLRSYLVGLGLTNEHTNIHTHSHKHTHIHTNAHTERERER